MVLAVYVPALVAQMLTTGLAEEPGWRDFALTRLQDRHHPLRPDVADDSAHIYFRFFAAQSALLICLPREIASASSVTSWVMEEPAAT